MGVDDCGCGCGGYCGIDWPDGTERAELARRPPTVTKRRFGWFEERRQQLVEIQPLIFLYAGVVAAIPGTGPLSRCPAPSACAAASSRVWNCAYVVHAVAIGSGGVSPFITASVSSAYLTSWSFE